MEEELDICSHGSRMGREEKLLLRIVIAETNDPSSIFPNSTNYFVPSYLKHLELDKFGLSQFLKYRSSDHPSLSAPQRLFAQRMQDVLLNRLDSSSKYDMYLHDLVDCLIQECHLNNGLNVYTQASKLPLRVDGRNYTLLSNREGRNVDGIVWILQEGFHKFDTRYKKGDVQLAASLIAACQANIVEAKGELKSQTLYGLKVLGEEFFFCRIDIKEDYLKEILANKKPSNDLIVYRYPKSQGLRISKLDDRRLLLYFFHKLREHMVSISLSR